MRSSARLSLTKSPDFCKKFCPLIIWISIRTSGPYCLSFLDSSVTPVSNYSEFGNAPFNINISQVTPKMSELSLWKSGLEKVLFKGFNHPTFKDLDFMEMYPEVSCRMVIYNNKKLYFNKLKIDDQKDLALSIAILVLSSLPSRTVCSFLRKKLPWTCVWSQPPQSPSSCTPGRSCSSTGEGWRGEWWRKESSFPHRPCEPQWGGIWSYRRSESPQWDQRIDVEADTRLALSAGLEHSSHKTIISLYIYLVYSPIYWSIVNR